MFCVCDTSTLLLYYLSYLFFAMLLHAYTLIRINKENLNGIKRNDTNMLKVSHITINKLNITMMENILNLIQYHLK